MDRLVSVYIGILIDDDAQTIVKLFTIGMIGDKKLIDVR